MENFPEKHTSDPYAAALMLPSINFSTVLTLLRAQGPNIYSAVSTRHNAPQAGADPLGRIGTCSFQKNPELPVINYCLAVPNLGVLVDGATRR
jgi:hypothetical protein